MLRRPVGAAPSAAWGQGAGRMDTSNPIRIVLLFFALAAAAGAMVFMVFLELLPESCESASRSSVGLLVQPDARGDDPLLALPVEGRASLTEAPRVPTVRNG